MNDISWNWLVQHVHDASWAQLAQEWQPLGIVYLCLAIATVVAYLVVRYYNKNVKGKPDKRSAVTDQEV